MLRSLEPGRGVAAARSAAHFASGLGQDHATQSGAFPESASGGVRVAFHGDTSLGSLAQKASTRCLEIAYGQPL